MLDEYLRQLNSRPPLTSAEESALWQAYKGAGDPASRYRLIEGHQALVVRIVLSLGCTPDCAMDLVQEGTIGLLEALESYDPDRGVPFPSFAQHRVRGRMLDYFGRQKAGAGDLSIDEPGVVEVAVAATGTAGRDFDPVARAEAGAVRRVLKGAVARLPRKEQEVLSAVYLHDQEPGQVAEELSISVSYVHRLQKRAIRRLRGMLARTFRELRASV
jgi:RNA polymerase sporulation-specific sigma factor